MPLNSGVKLLTAKLDDIDAPELFPHLGHSPSMETVMPHVDISPTTDKTTGDSQPDPIQEISYGKPLRRDADDNDDDDGFETPPEWVDGQSVTGIKNDVTKPSTTTQYMEILKHLRYVPVNPLIGRVKDNTLHI